MHYSVTWSVDFVITKSTHSSKTYVSSPCIVMILDKFYIQFSFPPLNWQLYYYQIFNFKSVFKTYLSVYSKVLVKQFCMHQALVLPKQQCRCQKIFSMKFLKNPSTRTSCEEVEIFLNCFFEKKN